MPAYFSLVSECNRDHIYDTILRDFYKVLPTAGLNLLGEYWPFMDIPYDELMDSNQKKLEDNYRLAFKEHAGNDYIQIVHVLEGFSEVRSFILNQPEKGIFTINIIVPEDDLIKAEDHKIVYDREKVDKLIAVAKKIYELPFVDLIQTDLELSDDPYSLEEITEGEALGVEPFAIVPDTLKNSVPEKYTVSEASGNGLLVTIDY
ncbi:MULTISPECIES: hypothetical protein [unclassified Butyrivibrio]|uniref:hypothetical protein n=1 Tax=unclassified Butyrivibrio TaxID=2639466 RepID=UPI0003B51D1A|nr:MULTISPECIES: hypothetical protein [unclassified Butyrivibrio]SEL27670.1 hypothetical protein SAMN04487770_10855 [Butyrivibrio sp. ob235]